MAAAPTRPEAKHRRHRAVALGAAAVLLAGSGALLGGCATASSAATGSTVTPATGAPTAWQGHQIHDLVGLGDSVLAGTACDCTDYVTLLGQAAQVAQQHHVDVSNLAIAGETSGQVLGSLGEQSTAEAVAGADTIVLTIGANDFDSTIIGDATKVSPNDLHAYDAALASMRANLAAILDKIGALSHSGDPLVLVTGYWNVFQDGAVARGEGSSYLTNSRALTLEVNAALKDVAEAHRATYVDLYTPFVGDRDDDTDLLTDDGDHPNAAGHQIIADALMDAVGIRH